MGAEVFWIETNLIGRVGIVPRPRGGDWLEDEVKDWRAAGVDIIVSLLMPDEIHELHLQSEESCCKNYGILFRSFPIQDRGVPSSRKLFIDLLNELREALESGKNVAIHCRQSIGRSSLVAASLLVLSGKEPDQAFNCIGKIRGRTVPDVPEQSEWVEKFADSLTNEHRDGKSKRSSASKSAFR